MHLYREAPGPGSVRTGLASFLHTPRVRAYPW